MALHPNAVYSPSVNLQEAGAAPDDILEIKSGPNVGHYVLRAVIDHIAFVEQELPSNDPGPVEAEIRKKTEKIATFTAAIVINQPLFNNGVSKWAAMDVWIS